MGKHQFAIGNDDFEVEVGVRQGNQVDVVVNGTSYEVELKSEVASAAIRAAAPVPSAPVAMAAAVAAPVAVAASAGAAGEVVAPLAGLVFKINVKEGDVIKAGDSVVVIEAMKMENAIPARADGTVTSIKVREQDSVAMGDVLITIG